MKAAIYVAMIVAAVALFLLIRNQGESLAPGAVQSPASAERAHKPDAIPKVLLALAAVICAGKLLGWAFRYIGQPPVIGEVVAGILLGPSLLGRISPPAQAWQTPQPWW